MKIKKTFICVSLVMFIELLVLFLSIWIFGINNGFELFIPVGIVIIELMILIFVIVKSIHFFSKRYKKQKVLFIEEFDETKKWPGRRFK